MAAPTALFALPAQVRTVAVDRTATWLAAGWRDLKRAPALGLAYGASFFALSVLFAYGVFAAGLGSLMVALAGGFILLAPILVVGLYEASRRLEAGEAVGFAAVWRACWARAGRIGTMGLVLTIVFLVWLEVALFLFAAFVGGAPPSLDRFVAEVLFDPAYLPFLAVGTLIGAALATVTFAISAVSIPMLMDRDVDVVSAIATSVAVVRANRQPMFGWAAAIAVILAAAVAVGFVGLVVALPVLGFATWHAYRDLVGPAQA